MRVLVTGAAGFIGSNFIHFLLNNTNCEVAGVDNLSGGFMDNLAPHIQGVPQRVRFFRANCLSEDDIKRIFQDFKPHVCYHFAAYAAEGLSPFIRRFNYINNTVATAIITNNCIQYDCKLIFTSSVAVYSGDPPFNENTQPRPGDPYGVGKYASEMDIRVAGEQHGLRYMIIRPRNVYGERQNIWDRYRNVFGIWMRQGMAGEPLTIYGDGSQVRAFTYIGDILDPLYKAAFYDGPHRTINLGSCFPVSILEAADKLKSVMLADLPSVEVKHLEGRHEAKEAYCEGFLQESELSYGFTQTSLTYGLKRMWEWARVQPRREIKVMPKEITKGLYEFYK